MLGALDFLLRPPIPAERPAFYALDTRNSAFFVIKRYRGRVNGPGSSRVLCCALALDIVLCPSLPDVAASRAEHLFESEDAIESGYDVT